jgi:ribosomal protein L37AE/L43A
MRVLASERVKWRVGGRPMSSVDRVLGVSGPTGKPLHLCPNCGEFLIATTWTERISERCVRNVWSCAGCGYEFETSAYYGAKQASA